MRLKALPVLAVAVALACMVFVGVSGAAIDRQGAKSAARLATNDCGGHPALLFGSHMPFPLSLFISGNAKLDIYLGKLHSRRRNELVLNVSKTLCSSSGGLDAVVLPPGTQVRRNGAAADVGSLRTGDVVTVILSQHGNFVLAGDSAFAGAIAAKIGS